MTKQRLAATTALLLTLFAAQSAQAFSTSTDSDVSTAGGVSRFSDPDDQYAGSLGSVSFGTRHSDSSSAAEAAEPAPVITPRAAVCTGPAGGCACPNCQGNK